MTRHPYPGLRAFTRDESDLFFGREGCVDEMVNRLGVGRFLAVLGPSGGGKSSLVRTGLFDALDLGFLHAAGTDWLVIDMHPAGQPMRQLATALLKSVSSSEPADDAINEMAKKLRQGPRSVAKWANEGNVPPGTNILLLVDQFEELFRYANYSEHQEADAFVALLLESAATKLHPIYVVITMRSEYLGACSSIEQLAEHISKGLYLTPRMEREACRKAIEGPAGVMGFQLEPALVNRMLNDLATFTPSPESNANDLGTQVALQADQLPLMQHVLNRLWLHAERTPHEGLAVLTLDDYKALGGMSGAIDAHGKEIVATLSPGAQAVIESVFRALVVGNSVASATRHPSKLRELVELAGGQRENVIEVVEAFRSRDCNFLRASKTVLDDETIVDISHESLIRQWTPLREWLEKEARDGAAWRRLVSAQERYAAGEDDLLTGLGYQSAVAWWSAVNPNFMWARRHGGDFNAVKEFFEASREAQERKRRAERDRQKRIRKRLVVGITVLAVVALVVSGLLLYRLLRIRLNKMGTAAAVNRHYMEAAKHFSNACELNDARACSNLAVLYENHSNDLAKNPENAINLYKKACALEDYSACSTLGMRYYNGDDNVLSDAKTAAKFDNMACEGGDSSGCSQLGILYALGEGGVPKNSDAALRLYQKACDDSDPLGCSALGSRYTKGGDGITIDMNKAAYFDNKACQGGRSSACNRLGDLYAAGNGVPRDTAKAMQLYKKACLGGDSAACDKWRPPAPK